MAFIATNTISQGDTRATGLQQLVARGAMIYEGTTNTPWLGDAAVTVSTVHVALGRVRAHAGPRRLNGAETPSINSRLRPSEERDDPRSLARNAGKSFMGVKPYGQGFVLTPQEREELLARNAQNGARIFPYVSGQDLNSDPAQLHSRYIIDFGDAELTDLGDWPDLVELVRRLVKPERDRNGRARRRDWWWQFGETTPGLRRALAPLERSLTCSRHSKHLAVAWQPRNRVFSEALNVFPLDGDAHLALLQSRVHEHWAWLLSSSIKTDLRYTASLCFETFAFPPDRTLLAGTDLDRAGKALNDARAAYCIDRNQGLTDTYNDLKDPTVTDPALVHLRELHLAVDRAVIEAYGWQDVPVPRTPGATGEAARETMPLIEAVPPYTGPTTNEEKRLHQRFEDAVIDQLFALNAVRAAEEARQAPKAKGAAKKAPAKNTKQGAFDL
jgi:hypothetical protein